MIYTQHYASPLGTLLLAADDGGLTGLWFEGAKYFAAGLSPEHTEAETPFSAIRRAGSTSISAAERRISCRSCIPLAPDSASPSGASCAAFPTDRR